MVHPQDEGEGNLVGRKRKKTRTQTNDENTAVNQFAARHGDYREAVIVDLSNELGGGRQKTYRVMKNHAQTIVDRWIHAGEFDDPQRRAIDHCRGLWHRLGGPGALVANLNGIGGGHSGRERGLEQAEALTLLGQYEDRIPRRYWNVFEGMVRNGDSAGMAGAHLTQQRAEQSVVARTTVAFVASMIAQWRGY